MNRRRITAVVTLAVVLATPSICHAHAVHPVYFGLGPMSLMIPFSNPPHLPKMVVGCLLFLEVIAAQSVILHVMIPGKGTFGNLWRATVAFVTGKVTESVCLIAIGFIGPLLFPWLAWSLESWEVVYVVPVLMFGAGVVVTASLIWLLVRKPERFMVSAAMGAAIVTILTGLPRAASGQKSELKLPQSSAVRAFQFSGPGLGLHGCRDRRDIDRIVRFLDEHNSGWKQDEANRFAEFELSLDVEAKPPLEICAGTYRGTAFLQRAISGEVLVREISVDDLSRLLTLCDCDLSLAFLQRDKGYYQKLTTSIFAERTRIEAKDVDKAAIPVLFDAILDYSRSNPADTDTTSVLRSLYSMEVGEFLPDLHAIDLSGAGGHIFTRMIVKRNGKALPATPHNCLALCRERFGDLNSRRNAFNLCTKVLEGSDRGTIIGRADEIPGYQDKPMSPEDERRIRAFSGDHKGEQLLYDFFVYERLGGCVWYCTLTVQGAAANWEMNEVARDIGAARYIM